MPQVRYLDADVDFIGKPVPVGKSKSGSFPIETQFLVVTSLVDVMARDNERSTPGMLAETDDLTTFSTLRKAENSGQWAVVVIG